MPNTRARKNILPGLQVPAGLPVELEKFLMAVKEALQGGQGTRGQPKERFVTLEDLERIGLITTMVKNGRGEIKGFNVEGVQTGLNVSFSSSSSSGNLSDLDDVIVANTLEGDVLRWRATSGVWQRGIAFDATGVLKDAVIPASVPRFDDVFTASVNGLVPAPITPAGYFLKDDGTWSAGGALGSLVFINKTVPPGNTIEDLDVETAFVSGFTFEADALTRGSVVRVRASGNYNTAAVAPTIILRLYLDAVEIFEATVVLNTAQTDAGWILDCHAVVRSVGATADLDARGQLDMEDEAVVHVAPTAAFTIDTTGELPFSITVEWDAADADNSITLEQLEVRLDTMIAADLPVPTITDITPTSGELET